MPTRPLRSGFDARAGVGFFHPLAVGNIASAFVGRYINGGGVKSTCREISGVKLNRVDSMLIAFLRKISSPFARSRLWISVPLVIGAIAIAIGIALLMPFIIGYENPPLISVQSVAPCAKGMQAHAVALSPTRFVIAITPHGNVTIDSINRFLSIADNIKTQGGSPLVWSSESCSTWDFSILADNGLAVNFAGAFVGSIFLSEISRFNVILNESRQSYLGYATTNEKLRGTDAYYLWDKQWNILRKAIEKDLFVSAHKVGVVYAESPLVEKTLRTHRIKYAFRVEVTPQQVLVPAANMAKDVEDSINSMNRPPIPVDAGVTGAVFTVDCYICEGRGGFGTRLGKL